MTMNLRTNWIVLGAAAVLAAGATGCDAIVHAEIEVPELCKTYADQKFPGAGPLAGITTSANSTIGIDVGADFPALNNKERETEVRLLHATFTPKSEVTDLDFIQALKLDVASDVDGSKLLQQNVVDYALDPNVGPSTPLVLYGNDTNLSPYIDERYIKLVTTVTGSLPRNDWTVDIKLCLYIMTEYEPE